MPQLANLARPRGEYFGHPVAYIFDRHLSVVALAVLDAAVFRAEHFKVGTRAADELPDHA